jgi:hypothetical protein
MKIRFSIMLIATVTTFGLLFSATTALAATKIKSGSACKSVGKVVAQKGKKFKCTKVGSKKIWKQVKLAPLGSLKRPAPIGTEIKIGDFKYTLTQIQPGVNQEICDFNMFNDGCDIDSNFDPILDPEFKKTWYRFIFTATNVGSEATNPTFADIGVSSLGTVQWEGIFQPVAPDRLKDLTVLPGATASGAWYVAVDNSATPNLLVVQIGYYDKSLFFFKMS